MRFVQLKLVALIAFSALCNSADASMVLQCKSRVAGKTENHIVKLSPSGEGRVQVNIPGDKPLDFEIGMFLYFGDSTQVMGDLVRNIADRNQCLRSDSDEDKQMELILSKQSCLKKYKENINVSFRLTDESSERATEDLATVFGFEGKDLKLRRYGQMKDGGKYDIRCLLAK